MSFNCPYINSVLVTGTKISITQLNSINASRPHEIEAKGPTKSRKLDMDYPSYKNTYTQARIFAPKQSKLVLKSISKIFFF